MKWQNFLDVVQRVPTVRKTLEQPLHLYDGAFGTSKDYKPSLGVNYFDQFIIFEVC
jgi:hypothetical protein